MRKLLKKVKINLHMQNSTKRYHSFDIIRGVSIIAIILLHRIHYHYAGFQQEGSAFNDASGFNMIILILSIALMTMAGIFYLVSGTVNGLSIYKRYSHSRLKRKQIMLGGVITGIWILLLHYFQRIFLMNGTLGFTNDDVVASQRNFPIGLINGWIRNGSAIQFSMFQITEPNTLSLIGLSILCISIILYFLLKPELFEDNEIRGELNQESQKKSKGKSNKELRKSEISKLYSRLFMIGNLVLILAPFLEYLLEPIYLDAYLNGNYFTAIICGHLIRSFGLFPYLGYILFGAMLGISLARGESLKEIKKLSNRIFKLWLIIGLLFLIFGDSDNPLGSCIMGYGLMYLELAIFVKIQMWALKKFDFKVSLKEKNISDNQSETEIDVEKIVQKENPGKFFLFVEKFGRLSLTIFILEPLLGEIVAKIFDLIFGAAWSQSLGMVLIMAIICLVLWGLILVLWKKIKYKGSFEWLTAIVIKKLSKKESKKLTF